MKPRKDRDNTYSREDYLKLGEEIGLNRNIAEFLYNKLLNSKNVKLDKRYYELNGRLWVRLKITSKELAENQFNIEEKNREKSKCSSKY